MDTHIQLNSNKKILTYPGLSGGCDTCNWVGNSSLSCTRMETHPNHYVSFGTDQKPHHTECNTLLLESFKIILISYFDFLFIFQILEILTHYYTIPWHPIMILSCILVTRHEHILHISAFTSRISSLLASNRVSVHLIAFTC